MEPQQGQKASDGALLCPARQRLSFRHTGTFSGLLGESAPRVSSRHTDDVKVSLSVRGAEGSTFLREGAQSAEVRVHILFETDQRQLLPDKMHAD